MCIRDRSYSAHSHSPLDSISTSTRRRQPDTVTVTHQRTATSRSFVHDNIVAQTRRSAVDPLNLTSDRTYCLVSVSTIVFYFYTVQCNSYHRGLAYIAYCTKEMKKKTYKSKEIKRDFKNTEKPKHHVHTNVSDQQDCNKQSHSGTNTSRSYGLYLCSVLHWLFWRIKLVSVAYRHRPTWQKPV